MPQEKTHHITAFVQSLSHEAAWQGCGTEGKVQRKQPIGAQRRSCDMAVFTVVTCSERHQQTKALDSHISVDVTHRYRDIPTFEKPVEKSEEIRGNPTLIQYKNH